MKSVISILLLFITIPLIGQISISGVVKEGLTNLPLQDVKVQNLKTKESTYTNKNGIYTIKGDIGDVLEFSSIEFKTIKRTVKKNTLNITLERESINLKEIEVLAKPNINDIDLRKATGAVAEVSLEKIKERPAVNILESLQGQVPGLTIKTNGELGKPLRVRIRGTSTLPIKAKGEISEEEKDFYDNRANQPLYVLDGHPITAEAFSMLNMNDIQSIKVLKDAAANALYGIKAANGVIEITSKRGRNGATQYSFSAQSGITLRGKPSVKMMQTDEKLEFERKVKNINTPGYYLSEEYFKTFYGNSPNLSALIKEGQLKLDSIKQINTDWFHELTRISTYQNYSLSISGGNDKSKFYVSGGYATQGGKFDGNNIERYSGRLNYELSLAQNVYVMFNSGLGISESNTPNASNYSPADMIYRLNPYEQKDKGMLISYPDRRFQDLVNQYSKTSKTSSFNFSTNISAKLSKTMYISSVLGVDYQIDESLAITPKTAYSEQKNGTLERERGKAVKNKNVLKSYSTNTRFNYEENFGKHAVSFSANVDFLRNNRDYIGISGYGLPSKLSSGAGINNSITGSRQAKTSSKKESEAQLGFGVSGLYEWNNKYSIYSSYKRDASSLLPSDKRWNTFWATGVGYTISEEPFLKDSKIISLLKLRATYGKTASLAGVSASLTVPTFSYEEISYLGLREFSLVNLYNENLRPEKNTSYNIGLDFGLFNRANLSVEVYKRITEDMLLTVPIAPSNGFVNQMKNVGVLENKGIELSANVNVIKNHDFKWSVSGNLAYNKNKIIDLYDTDALYLTGTLYPDYKEGEPYDLLYGLIDLGVFPADGVPRYLRADGSEFNINLETPNEEDFIILGYANAPYTGGFYQSFSYKGWQLSCDMYFSFGGKAKYTNKSVALEDSDVFKNAVSGQLEKTWFKPGDENKTYPNPFLGTGEQYDIFKKYATTLTTGKTDFIRINNIMLRYNFDTEFLKRITHSYIKYGSFYAQLKNIATFSNFGGGDPESANLAGSVQPVITMGANISF